MTKHQFLLSLLFSGMISIPIRAETSNPFFQSENVLGFKDWKCWAIYSTGAHEYIDIGHITVNGTVKAWDWFKELSGVGFQALIEVDCKHSKKRLLEIHGYPDSSQVEYRQMRTPSPWKYLKSNNIHDQLMRRTWCSMGDK